jgi:hypothetical protein
VWRLFPPRGSELSSAGPIVVTRETPFMSREQYEAELMAATHREAGGDGLYGKYTASYERPGADP